MSNQMQPKIISLQKEATLPDHQEPLPVADMKEKRVSLIVYSIHLEYKHILSTGQHMPTISEAWAVCNGKCDIDGIFPTRIHIFQGNFLMCLFSSQ